MVAVLGLVGLSGFVAAISRPGNATNKASTVVLNGVALTPTYHSSGAGMLMRAPAAPARSAASLERAAAPGGTAVSGGKPAAPEASPLIEETGAVTVVVPGSQLVGDVNVLMGIAVGSGGFVASTSTQSASPGTPATGSVTLQVPLARFGTVLGEVRSLGKVTFETTQATDVTGQYVDLQAQVTALESSRTQYLTIMTKATTIGAILAVQSQLDSLQSQLDQIESQLKTLTNETTYATLGVALTEKVVTPPPPKPRSGLDKAWHAAINGFVAGCEGVVRAAGPLFFALLLVGALAFVVRFAWRLRRRSAA